ncbi:hypothetical protein I3F58_03350 [Streptomyces sp. MUM 203J]|nr:hypothetical protein [Streptomyces sp. MUM 203J]MCH0538610.1 hypothetical protein [Streptomyces sp. MUM 203J]
MTHVTHTSAAPAVGSAEEPHGSAEQAGPAAKSARSPEQTVAPRPWSA